MTLSCFKWFNCHLLLLLNQYPKVPQQFHIQPQHIQQQQQLQAQQLQLHHQQIQIQQSPLQQAAAQQHQQQAHAQMTHPQQTTHTSMLQSPQSIHIEITPQQQASFKKCNFGDGVRIEKFTSVRRVILW